MKDIIKQLFIAFKDTSMSDSPEKQEANKAEEQLLSSLNKEQIELFYKYCDEQMKVDYQHAVRDFRQGLCLGCLISEEIHKEC